MRLRLAVALLLIATPVLAHSWYPAECCSDQDCHEIPDTAVREESDGSYTVLASGERFYPPGSQKMVEGYSPEGGAQPMRARTFKWSKDGSYHRCTPAGQDGSSWTFCLFIPQPGV